MLSRKGRVIEGERLFVGASMEVFIDETFIFVEMGDLHGVFIYYVTFCALSIL